MTEQMTRGQRLARLLATSRVIASIKDDAAIDQMLSTRCRVGFLLYGSISTLPDQLKALREGRRVAFVDIDLIDGLAADPAGVEYLRKEFGVQGVLSNRAQVVKAATQVGMVGVHRHFMIDSMAFHNLERQIRQATPDAVELLPGCIPKVISWLRASVAVPIIAGGLIHDEEDVRVALEAGASAIATSNAELWDCLPGVDTGPTAP